MGIIELLLLAVGLSMDAFAASVCKGLVMKRINLKSCLLCGVWFGSFQALMPICGYILGSRFEKIINTFAPWIAFVLLVLIGGNMIREALSKKEEETNAGLDTKTMFIMAVATSIDALAVGITFACVPIAIVPAGVLMNTIIGAFIIGVVTLILSCIGVKIGNIFGTKYKTVAEIIGGVILFLIGVKTLAQHFGVFV